MYIANEEIGLTKNDRAGEARRYPAWELVESPVEVTVHRATLAGLVGTKHLSRDRSTSFSWG